MGCDVPLTPPPLHCCCVQQGVPAGRLAQAQGRVQGGRGAGGGNAGCIGGAPACSLVFPVYCLVFGELCGLCFPLPAAANCPPNGLPLLA